MVKTTNQINSKHILFHTLHLSTISALHIGVQDLDRDIMGMPLGLVSWL